MTLADALSRKALVLRIGIVVTFGIIVIAILWPIRDSSRATVNWDTAIAPYGSGRAVTLGYVLSPPHRGEDHDVIFIARRQGETPSLIEIHILDRGRWSGIRETDSYGVAYEQPRSTASATDCATVTNALADAIAHNDHGLGPVDSISLTSEHSPPLIARHLSALTGLRGIALALLSCALVAAMLALPRGGLVLAIVLTLVGLILRNSNLDLPFVRDQDIQRIFTGKLPLFQMFSSVIGQERRPPFYFVVLHLAEWWGQGPIAVRTPSVICGTLAAPTVLLMVWLVRGRVGVVAGLTAFIVSISPELIDRCREVSELSLFSLILLVMAVSTIRAREHPSRSIIVTVVVSHALLLWTSYLAVFPIAGELLAIVALRRHSRVQLRAIVAGVIAGSPSVLFAVTTFVRDRHARAVAHDFPSLSWGERRPLAMTFEIVQMSANMLGFVLLVIALVLCALAIRKRDETVVVPLVAGIATVVGIIALSPIARMQPYYVMGAIVAVPMAVSVASFQDARILHAGIVTMLVASVALIQVPALARSGPKYMPDPAAFGPRFADVIAARQERKIVVVAHYDGTLISYYLAQKIGVSIDWRSFNVTPTETRIPSLSNSLIALAGAHDLDSNSGARARERLESLASAESVLVIQRYDFRLDAVDAFLQRCVVLEEAPLARLLRCGP